MTTLPADPRVLSDDDVVAWVKDAIDRRTEKSNWLDYKADLGDLSNAHVKRELAKDVSSFANERGGVVLYAYRSSSMAEFSSLRRFAIAGFR